MKVSEYASASGAERAAARAAQARRVDSATGKLRRMSEVEMAEIVWGAFPEATSLRVALDDGDDTECGGIGIYVGRVNRLDLIDFWRRPAERWKWDLRRLVQRAWGEEGGRDAWPTVNGKDEDDYPSGYDEIHEIRLPRPPS